MITNDSLKEYYVKLQGMYENAVNMLTAINQSLSTSASEITVTLNNADGTTSTTRIPSFIYLENKLEQIDTNFANLFNMPNSGEAWFTRASNMFKLNFVRSGTAPTSPILEHSNVIASFTDNNFLKDLVSPKTFLKVKIENLPDTIDTLYMKKLVFFNKDIFDAINAAGLTSYNDIKAALYNFSMGSDYEEYDSTIQMPVRKDTYYSAFKITELPNLTEDGGTNPWCDFTGANHKKLSYKVRLDTFEYGDQEDSSIVFNLKVGDYLCLGNQSVIYKVKNVNTDDMTVIIEEMIGHIALQTFEENSEMVLQLYNEDYSKYHYAQVPLEENQYICVFLGTISNNVRSNLSDAYIIDLSKVYITDKDGNYIDDGFGNHMSYIEYYNKYCTNIGDLILGLTEAAYPQLSNYPASVLDRLQSDSSVQEVVTQTLNVDEILEVVPINKHLTDDVTSDEIVNLHAQKNDINAQLQTVQDNISQVYSTIINTDFSQDVTITQASLQAQVQQYYTERTSLQKQLNAIIDNINSKAMDLRIVGSEVKYRIRGIANTALLDDFLHSTADAKMDAIGMEIEYKYKSTSKDTTSLTVINSSTFTDWVRQSSIDRQRKLAFNDSLSAFRLEYVDYGTTDNIIKWNQVDIPIQEGEDVIIRVRYKLNVGQPFVNVYTPWSDEFTVIFPEEYENDVEVQTIVDTNRQDSIKAAFSKTLIDEGYAEHVQNKVVSSEQTFFHQPENIYSGFNTPENKLIPLKDKLLDMNNLLEKYRVMLDNAANAKFEVYLTYDDNQVLLSPNTINKINVYNSDHIVDSFIKKPMNLVIKNTGDVRVNMYSIFPGNTDIPLITSDIQFYNEQIVNYERIPIMINNNLSGQYLGQWIYFRENNAYTRKDLYLNDPTQNAKDALAAAQGTQTIFDIFPTRYIGVDNRQVLLANRQRTQQSESSIMSFGSAYFEYDEDGNPTQAVINNPIIGGTAAGGTTPYKDKDLDFYIYSNYKTPGCGNKFLMCYEDIRGINAQGQPVFLDQKASILNFVTNYSVEGFSQDTDFNGAFLYPNLLSKEQVLTEGREKDSIYIEVGESKSIPLVFEYFVDGTIMSSVTKSIHFDLRNSLISNPMHYMIEVTGNYDYTATGDIYSNIEVMGIEDNASTGF